ncbi:MAG: hypothetical protein GKS03_04450 [Alphaproteobacteria bacterium]|nr:hypothetical protein [Alphaproteobacteria bacterium]
MPQGLIRIVMPLLMVMAFLLYLLSAGLETGTPEDPAPPSPNSSSPNAEPG